MLLKYQCGFCKDYNSQHYLITMIEKWRESAEKDGASGALLNDLSNVFYCLPHALFITYDYLYGRWQRFKVGGAHSLLRELLYGVPQRSILGLLLLHIFLCYLFYFIEGTDIESYADDTKLYNANLRKYASINMNKHFRFFPNGLTTTI